MTTRGLDEADFREVAAIVDDVLRGREGGIAARIDVLTR
jgi:glycine/serine hydroxymethyltransferase